MIAIVGRGICVAAVVIRWRRSGSGVVGSGVGLVDDFGIFVFFDCYYVRIFVG